MMWRLTFLRGAALMGSRSMVKSPSLGPIQPYQFHSNYYYKYNYNQYRNELPIVPLQSYRQFQSASQISLSSSSTDDKKNKEGGREEGKKVSRIEYWKKHIWEGLVFYWNGTVQLGRDIKTAYGFQKKVLAGQSLTRRERAQLVQTTADIWKLVPFSIFVIVPFLEFALPFFLKIFPNMLPSTYQDNFQKEETYKKQITLKLEMAKFLQETTMSLARDKNMNMKGFVENFLAFMNKIRNGERVTSEELSTYSQVFSDEFTLTKLDSYQLQAFCRFVGMSTLGTDDYLRFQIKKVLRKIQLDDEVIRMEKVESLTDKELAHALMERGIRTDAEMDRSVKVKKMYDWLRLSLDYKIPPALLILSQAVLMSGAASQTESLIDTMMAVAPTGEKQEELARHAANDQEEALKREHRNLGNKIKLILKEQEDEGILDVANKITTATNTLTSKLQSKVTLDEEDIRDVLSSLREMADPNLMRREMEELKTIQQEFNNVTSTLTVGPVQLSKVKDLAVLQQRMSKFTQKLEKEMKEFATSNKDKLHLLDLDGDGFISITELDIALKFLKTKHDVSDILNMISKFDTDRDGRIKLVDLERMLSLIEKRFPRK